MRSRTHHETLAFIARGKTDGLRSVFSESRSQNWCFDSEFESCVIRFKALTLQIVPTCSWISLRKMTRAEKASRKNPTLNNRICQKRADVPARPLAH